MTIDPAIPWLSSRVAELEREVADLRRQNEELREAVAALLQPAPSELLARNRAHPSRATSENFTDHGGRRPKPR